MGVGSVIIVQERRWDEMVRDMAPVNVFINIPRWKIRDSSPFLPTSVTMVLESCPPKCWVFLN